AIAIAKRIVAGGVKQRDKYLEFLSAGGSQYPLDTLKRAGIDLATPEPVSEAMNTFKALVDELESLL
ncbi:MAG TPA: oligoendopeptidase F, partial [Candidatus Hydrogenedentes bacterium]|nr:oligoendopeptidase F [Candidatus Hydrogenedentota bacterium]